MHYMLAIGGLTAAVCVATLLLYAVQYRNVRDLVVLAVAATVIVSMRLPLLLGDQLILAPLTIASLAVAGRLATTHRTRLSRSGLVVLAFAGIMGVTVIRGALAGVYATVPSALLEAILYVTVAWFAMTIVAHAETDEIRRRRLVAIALAPTVFVGTTVLLHFAGFSATGVEGLAVGETATIPQLVGVTMERVQLPLGGSVNTMGIIAAVSIASCLVLAAKRAAPLWITAPGVGVGLFAIAISDTRAALIIALSVSAWLAFSRRTIGTRAIAIAIPLLPLLMMWLISLNERGPVGKLLSRDTGDFATGNGRVEIWQKAWPTVKQFTPDHVFGWGANGQITSGASFDYASVFRGNDQPWRFTTHDIALQMILDAGIVGLALLVLAVIVAAGPLQRAAMKGSPASALLAIIAVAVLSGVTEVSPSYGSAETLVAMLMAVGAAVSLPGVAPSAAPGSEPAAPPEAAQEPAVFPLRRSRPAVRAERPLQPAP